MTNYDFFRTITHRLYDSESKKKIYSDDLLELIKDSDLKELIINKYNLQDNILINVDKIDIVHDEIKKYVDRFELIRLNVFENKVDTYLKENPENKKSDYYFKIKEACDDEGVIKEEYKDLEAVAIYDSLHLFYKDRYLSQYVKSLNRATNLSKGQLLDDLNVSWKRYFNSYPDDVKPKIFRILKNNDFFYIKSINSRSYKEYGIAESFVLSMFELNKIHLRDKKVNFCISSISLRESKIDMIISLDRKVTIENIGYFRPSISIRNEDQGTTSLGVYTSLEFYPKNSKENKIYLFPSKDRDNNKIENKSITNHTVNQDTLLDLFNSISGLFDYLKEIENDFGLYQGAKTADELKQKIEEKVCSSKGMFKNVTKLQDLFSKENTGHINNLKALLQICGQAEMLDMEYDLKFKLRYLISNVLLYGNNQM